MQGWRSSMLSTATSAWFPHPCFLAANMPAWIRSSLSSSMPQRCIPMPLASALLARFATAGLKHPIFPGSSSLNVSPTNSNWKRQF